MNLINPDILTSDDEEDENETYNELDYGKLANNPYKPALNLSDYKCLLWICYDDAEYEFDYISEHSITGDNSINNIQTLTKL